MNRNITLFMAHYFQGASSEVARSLPASNDSDSVVLTETTSLSTLNQVRFGQNMSLQAGDKSRILMMHSNKILTI